MNLDLADVSGGLLVVSQFTLAADTASGNRPGFPGGRAAELGRRIYERVLPPPRLATATSRTASSAPTCRSTWSTTDR